MKKVEKTRNASKEVSHVRTVGTARKESRLQLWLDRAQLSILKGEITLKRSVQAGKNEIDAMRKTLGELAVRGFGSIADYAALQTLHDKELSKITKETLAEENSIAAEKKKGDFLGDISKEQAKVIDRFYAMKAEKEWATLAHIREILAASKKKVTKDEIVAAKEVIEKQQDRTPVAASVNA